MREHRPLAMKSLAARSSQRSGRFSAARRWVAGQTRTNGSSSSRSAVSPCAASVNVAIPKSTAPAATASATAAESMSRTSIRTPGCFARNVSIASGIRRVAAEGTAAMRTRPCAPVTYCRMLSTTWSYSANARRACASKKAPSGVKRPLRSPSKSAPPMSDSICLSVIDTAAGVRPIRMPASANSPASATATKTRSCSSFMVVSDFLKFSKFNLV